MLKVDALVSLVTTLKNIYSNLFNLFLIKKVNILLNYLIIRIFDKY